MVKMNSVNYLNFSDYSPFGMLLPNTNIDPITGLVLADDEYRYGFNSMEKDDEVSGEGNSYTTEFRQYDSRIGRWLSLDPLMAKYPHQSPYVAFNNNPIYYSDPTGLEGEEPFEEASHVKTEWKNRADAFPVDPQNGDVVVIDYIGDGGFSGTSQAYEYQEDVDKWMLKGSKQPDFNNGEWTIYDNSSIGIPAKHIKITEAPSELSDISSGVSLESTIVGSSAEEVVKETVETAKKYKFTPKVKGVTKVVKASKVLGAIGTAIEVGIHTYEMAQHIKNGNTEEAVESGLKAGFSIGASIAAAAAYGSIGGPVGVAAAIVVGVAWTWVSSLDW